MVDLLVLRICQASCREIQKNDHLNDDIDLSRELP